MNNLIEKKGNSSASIKLNKNKRWGENVKNE
jgi:hypothetical protein